MTLFVLQLRDKYVAEIDLRLAFSRAELNAVMARGISRKRLREDLFAKMVREAADLPIYTEPVDEGPVPKERAAGDFFRRIAPFLLPELAHEGAAFIADEQATSAAERHEFSQEDERFVDELLDVPSSKYIDLPTGSLLLSKEKEARAIFITPVAIGVSKWSAVIADTRAEESPLAVITWYKIGRHATRCVSVLGVSGLARESCNEVCRQITVMIYRCLAMTQRDRQSEITGAAPEGLTRVQPAAIDNYSADEEITGVRFKVTYVRQKISGATHRPTAARPLTNSKHIIVLGHWRNVACGKGRAERRRTWIEPFHKGPRDQPLETRMQVTRISSSN